MAWLIDYLPASRGNQVTFYVDGHDYCADLHSAISQARSHIFLTGLHFMGDFGLIRRRATHPPEKSLENALKEAALLRNVRVFLLVNQFWVDEDATRQSLKSAGLAQDSDVFDGLHAEEALVGPRAHLMVLGELYNYLPATYQLFERLKAIRRVHCRTDLHPMTHLFGTHHQKTVVVDDKIAFLGGIDLTYVDGDRWDTPYHKEDLRHTDRTQKFWHDVHLRLIGPGVKYVRANFEDRWDHGSLHTLSKANQGIVATPEPYHVVLPVPIRTDRGDTDFRPDGSESPHTHKVVQIVRSMPNRGRFNYPKQPWNGNPDAWEHSCHDAYLVGIAAAKQYIYLENQWVNDELIWSALAKAASDNRDNPTFRIIIVLPYEPLFAAGMGSNQELWIGKEIANVMANCRDGWTFGMYSLVEADSQIYIHSKILLVDDCWALVGSANAGGISLQGIRSGKDRPDTELSAVVLDDSLVPSLRKNLWQEHLGTVEVGDRYRSEDANNFRRLAHRRGRTGERLRYFPTYEEQLKDSRSLPYTPHPWEPDARRLSCIQPVFPGKLRMVLPAGVFNPAFKVLLIPPPPRIGFRPWYRWRCELFPNPSERRRVFLELLSLSEDKSASRYTEYSSVYISDPSVAYAGRSVATYGPARIVCWVQLVPWSDLPDESDSSYPTFSVGYVCRFVNSDLASREFGPAYWQLVTQFQR